MQRRLVDTKEIAQQLSIKPSTIYKWIHEGRIPHYKVGKLVRFSEKEVWDWVVQQRRRTRSDALSGRRSW